MRTGTSRAFPTYFNPRPPCGGRLEERGLEQQRVAISIHVPRAGDDPAPTAHRRAHKDFNPRPPCGGRRWLASVMLDDEQFQSTSPVRGTTSTNRCWCQRFLISIHVPRAGDDQRGQFGGSSHTDFNPRPPCGGRRWLASVMLDDEQFQSTSPVRGTTFSLLPLHFIKQNFNPRPPCGGRLLRRGCLLPDAYFNPRPPCGGRPCAGR